MPHHCSYVYLTSVTDLVLYATSPHCICIVALLSYWQLHHFIPVPNPDCCHLHRNLLHSDTSKANCLGMPNTTLKWLDLFLLKHKVPNCRHPHLWPEGPVLSDPHLFFTDFTYEANQFPSWLFHSTNTSLSTDCIKDHNH